MNDSPSNPPNSTRRATVAALEAVLFESFSMLDHGFVRVIDYMGDDSAVVQAARVSYGRGTKSVSEDQGLINFLMRHHHSTPFEMCSLKLHIKLPIFVARQWIRHRTASVNEVSARYSILDREFYIPAAEHLATQAKDNKQGRSTLLTSDEATRVQELLREDAMRNYDHYQWLLNEDSDSHSADSNRSGIARELARMNLTLNSYTQWYWSLNLHNLMHFLRLRNDPHAQYEIRVYAEKIEELVRLWVPQCHNAFLEYRKGSATLSRTMLAVLRRRLAGEQVEQATSGLSQREWNDLQTLLL